MFELILESFIDTLKALPILYAVYLLFEYLNHHTNSRLGRAIFKRTSLSPVVGAAVGCVPQCGFSAAAADLFSKRLITTGTLVAVFLSTSDEAIPVLLAYPKSFGVVLIILFVKFLAGAIFGLVIDLFLRQKECQRTAESKIDHCKDNIFIAALRHTVVISLYIFAASLLIGLFYEIFGEDKLSSLLMTNSIFQPVLTAVIGLIPNCAVSVLLAQLYMKGTIDLGSAIAGLCTGAGFGLIVLFRLNRNIMENIRILMMLLAIGASVGVFVRVICKIAGFGLAIFT